MSFSTVNTERPLILSLEFLFNTLNSSGEKKLAVDVFFIIGLMPNGLYKEDLTRMLEVNLDDSIGILKTCCLIEETYEKKLQRFKYNVSPFVDQFVDLKISQENQQQLYNILAQYSLAKLS
jgi:hypothetical protein